ncbi:magnesium/manganese-dependent protein phosphatase [Actinoplanes sp. SE50]|uniref:PP2C family protein-serine/threonine phosphatase n=1 Tax=unclassified Actinoplanes TaxID=2626549 RepID=UPI00023ED65A|nr:MULTISPECIES: PP2C family protein-serine/threonine phosphatase [unclassified Actinoplanes]AEV86200.1 Phosphoserine phosphatase rsbU [Actinoplanes sp. SE50/110]ATO84598.1 magnesium/manganese-dependent protein phosphatase [Actinoplanes sp. SE50]SLM02008.1 magnesium/manganese-dependent protein phosphatase [Actinoplanes sp. SE50/110]
MSARMPATAAPPGLLRAVLDAASEAMLLCAAAGDTVVLVNEAARALLPGLQPGDPLTAAPLPELAAAAAAGGESFRSEDRQHCWYGRRRAVGDEHYVWFLADGAAERDRTAALEAERARAAFLADAGRRLSASLHSRLVRRTTVELAAAHLADAAVVILPPDKRQSAWSRALPGHPVEEGTLPERNLAEVPGLGEVIDGFPPIPSRWLDPAQTPGWLFPAALGPLGALLVIPLPGNAEPAGALILARTGTFSPEEEALARVYAARAGAALAAAALYQEQVATAAVLQADLLPPELPEIDGFELAGSYQAARETMLVGGDFYEVFGPVPGSTDTVVALGDVCGTGPEAAVLTGKVRQTLRALRLMHAGPETMLRVLNRALTDSGRRQRFVTLVVGSVTRVDHGRICLELASGGHPPPLVLRADGRVEEVPTGGTLIGVMPETTVRPATAELGPGELCLLYSDGLTEARGGPAGDEQFGETRLRRALSDCAGLPGAVTLERLRQLVSDWVRGGPGDDIAMLAVRAHPRPPLSLRDGGATLRAPNQSPYLTAARRPDRRVRPRS